MISAIKTRLGLALCAALAAGLCQAASPNDEIVIGHIAGYTGPAKKDATEMGLGAKVMFDSLNAKGGVLGRKVRMVVADDHFKPEETDKLISSMAANKVSALLPTTGSANLQYVFKQGTLDKITLPIVGTIPSNESFRTPMRKNIFHFRAGDRDQLTRIVEQLTTIGIRDIAIFARNNTSGAEGGAIITEELQKRGLKPVAHLTYDVNAKDGHAEQVGQLAKLRPSAIVLLGTPQGIADAAKYLKKAGVPSVLYAVSYADYQQVAKHLGPQMAHGFVISQVLPNLNNLGLPLIKAFRDDFAQYSGTKDEPTHFNLEGYISARLIVEAIRRSKDASPQGVIRGLETMREYDMGGYFVDFSPTKHVGSSWVDLSIISGKGALLY